MKLVVGDRVGIYVGTFFDSYAAYSSMSCILVTLLYSIQIYWDFVGYSFITIGVVRMMGFQLQIHIEKPYFAVSVTDFGWRWYISLSSCSRDYFLYHLVETEWNVGEITGISWRRSSFLVYGMERLIICHLGRTTWVVSSDWKVYKEWVRGNVCPTQDAKGYYWLLSCKYFNHLCIM